MNTIEQTCSPATVRACMGEALSVLDAELRVLSNPADDPDYALLRDLIRFLGELTPALYYPVIEQLYAEVPRHVPDLADTLADLERKHVSHRPLADDLVELLAGVSAGHLVPRERILKETAAYAELLRQHIIPADLRLAAAFDALPEHSRMAAADRVEAADDESSRARRWDEWETLFASIESRHRARTKRRTTA